MNPDAYGPQPPNIQATTMNVAPNPMQTTLAQHQKEQQQQLTQAGWSKQAPPPPSSLIAGNLMSTANNMPPSAGTASSSSSLQTNSTQAQDAINTLTNVVNGNYQQQLTQSMNAMTMHSVNQPINPQLQQQQHQAGLPPASTATLTNSTFNNTNNTGILTPMSSSSGSYTLPATSAVAGAAPYINGPSAPPPLLSTTTTQPSINNNNCGNYTNGPAVGVGTSEMTPVPGSKISGQSFSSSQAGGQQMTINSANLPGLPHLLPQPQSQTQVQNSSLNSTMPPPPLMSGQQSTMQSGYANNQYPSPPGPQYPVPAQQQRQQQQQQQILGRSMISSNMPPMPGQMSAYSSQATQQMGYPSQSQMSSGYLPQMIPPQQQLQPHQQMPGRQANGNFMPQPGSGGHMFNYQPEPPQYPPPQKQKTLDPEQMPNPIQVMIENQSYAGGPFVTNQPGLLPPLVTTKYVVQDQGNSSPRFVRSSLYCIPSNTDVLKIASLPFCLIVSPYARLAEGEFAPPIVDFGPLGPIRCNRCKAYMSPNMQFVDAGRRFQCLMCKVATEVPTEYFQYLDHTGQRVDKYERPELVLGTYEFLATKDYCRNNVTPEIPAFIFVIDVSYNTMKSGLVHLLCSHIKRILKNLPVDQGQTKSKIRVGFITFNNTVHFYNIKSNLGQPQMMMVGDVQDMFMPLLDGFLACPEESETVIDALLEQIPKMFLETKETECVLYPAIQAGLEALKASNAVGKLLVFNSTLPIAEAPGKLKNRDDRKLLGTDKEKTVLIPQCQSYNQLGQECVQNGCSVDLFIFNNSYIDIATIGQVARLTGGEIYKYTYFQAEIDGKRLIEDIIKNISRPIAFDAVMRVRSSAGIRATDFYGHFYMSNTTDIELASIDCNKSLAIEIKYDDKLPPEEHAYLQIALLYTSCSGQRRLRIFNLALQVTATIADVFKHCDLDAMVLFFAKQACFKLMDLTPKVVKDTLIHRTAQILAAYRKHCTAPTSAGQLILPENLKLLPLYLSCLLKNDAISGGSDMTLDDRSYVIHFILAMDLNISVNHLYPRFFPIHNLDGDADENDMPMPLRCTHSKMVEDGAYILENGVHFFVWLGQSLPSSFIQPLFGVQCTAQVHAERFAITGDTSLANRLRHIIDKIMKERTRYMRITCVRQNDKMESVFRHFLVEDRGTDGSASYVDFLCHMHKEIKDLLS